MTRIYLILVGLLAPLVCPVAAAASDPKAASFEVLYTDPSEAIKHRSRRPSGSIVAKEMPGQPMSQGDTEKRKSPLVNIKDLLKGVPAGDRAEFVAQLMLVDGQVVSANLAPLKKSLRDEQVNAILDGLTGSSDDAPIAASGKGAKRPRMVQPGNLLKGVPEDVRNAFYESMIFQGSELVSFWIGGLEGVLSKAELKKVLESLGTTTENDSKPDPKALCGDGWCEDSICDFPETGPIHCIALDDWVCKTNCRSRR